MGNETTETTSDPRATFTQRAQRHLMDVFSEGNTRAITYVPRAAGKQLPLYGITFGTQSSPLWGIRPSRPQAIHGATLTQRAQIQQMTEATVSGA